MHVHKAKIEDARILGLASAPPTDNLQGAARRLRIAAMVWIGLWSTGLVMNNFVGPLLSPERPLDDAWPWPGNPAAIGCILLSLGVVIYTRRRSAGARRILDLALIYEVALAFAIGVVNQWTPNIHGLSWICVLIVVHPLLVPNAPAKTFLASVAAASMDLVGIGITAARGVAIPDATVLLWTYLPNYICAFIAVLPAHLITKLSHEVRSARELGSYRLGEILGRGGMGEVYRAEHRMLARPAAIKLVRPELFRMEHEEQTRVIQRFQREARVTARMCSPHTISVYDYGIAEGGTFYYVMELLDGFDLETFVQRFGPLPAARAVYFLEQVCDSLAEAHANELIHRDIKPANVYVCRYGTGVDFIKVLDFGLVKPVAPGEREITLSAENVIGGTPGFMAPEQALGNRAVDPRTDLYSVGCLGYWLLTGQLVFEGQNSIEVIAKHASQTPVPPSQRTELELPEPLELLILACLEKEPEKRPQSAEELAQMLAPCAPKSWTREMARDWWNACVPEGGQAHTGVTQPAG